MDFLFSKGIFAWREDDTGIPTSSGRLRPGGKKGKPDIISILPSSGRFLGIEVKTGKDKLRPEQQGFKINVEKMGGLYLEVKSFTDFLDKFPQISYV